jgi:hypothetical protein
VAHPSGFFAEGWDSTTLNLLGLDFSLPSAERLAKVLLPVSLIGYVIAMEIRHYVSRAGVDVFAEWLADDHAKARIANRIDRLAMGNFGGRKSLGEGCLNCASTGDRAFESNTQ